MNEQWTEWIHQFNQQDALSELVPCLPSSPQLPQSLYVTILSLLVSRRKFQDVTKALQYFPLNRESLENAETLLEGEQISEEEKEDFMKAKYKVASLLGSHNQAFAHLLELKSQSVFSYLQLHPDIRLDARDIVALLDISVSYTAQLVASKVQTSKSDSLKSSRNRQDFGFSDYIPKLRHSFSHPKGLSMLAAQDFKKRETQNGYESCRSESQFGIQLEEAPPLCIQDIVTELQEEKMNFTLYQFLHEMYKINPKMIKEFHNLMPGLYAQYSPEMLIGFLEKSHSYDLAETLQLCKRKLLIPEVAFLLERLGNLRQMILCLVDMGNIWQALSKIVKHNYFCERELWDLLVSVCISQLRYNLLLKQLLYFKPGWSYIPSDMIWAIPLDTRFKKIRTTSMKVVSHFRDLSNVYEGAVASTRSDFHSLPRRFTKAKVFRSTVSDADCLDFTEDDPSEEINIQFRHHCLLQTEPLLSSVGISSIKIAYNESGTRRVHILPDYLRHKIQKKVRQQRDRAQAEEQLRCCLCKGPRRKL